jgi:hypothetical protein
MIMARTSSLDHSRNGGVIAGDGGYIFQLEKRLGGSFHTRSGAGKPQKPYSSSHATSHVTGLMSYRSFVTSCIVECLNSLETKYFNNTSKVCLRLSHLWAWAPDFKNRHHFGNPWWQRAEHDGNRYCQRSCKICWRLFVEGWFHDQGDNVKQGDRLIPRCEGIAT